MGGFLFMGLALVLIGKHPVWNYEKVEFWAGYVAYAYNPISGEYWSQMIAQVHPGLQNKTHIRKKRERKSDCETYS